MIGGASAGLPDGVVDEDLAVYLSQALPAEKTDLQKRREQLAQELEIVTKFEREFTKDMYDGVDAEDRAKVADYVNFFGEFKSAINNDTAALQRETAKIQQNIETCEACFKMIDSMLVQIQVVTDLRAKYERQKFDTTKRQMAKEVAALEAEWKMFANKKAKLDDKSDETAHSDML